MNNSRIVANLSSLRRHLLSDCKKALQKVALAPAGSRGGGAEGEGEAETTLVQAEALSSWREGSRTKAPRGSASKMDAEAAGRRPGRGRPQLW